MPESKFWKLAQEDAYIKTDPQDSPETVSSTVRLINRESADRARIYQRQANTTARNRIELANIEIAKMTAETQMALAGLRANRYGYNNNGYGNYNGLADNYGNPYYGHNTRYNNNGNGYVDPYARTEISNANYIRTDYIRTDGQVQANKALTEGYTKSASVYESATNLKDQILKPVAPGGARLRALGTSLYARYYGDGMPSTDEAPVIDPPLPAMHATAKSIEETTNDFVT